MGVSLRVLDAGAEEAYEGLPDRLTRLVDIVHGEIALVELAIFELSLYGIGDDVLDALRGGLRESLTVASIESASIRMPASLLWGRPLE